MKTCFNVDVKLGVAGEVTLRKEEIWMEFFPRPGDNFNCGDDLIVKRSCYLCDCSPNVEVDFEDVDYSHVNDAPDPIRYAFLKLQYLYEECGWLVFETGLAHPKLQDLLKNELQEALI